MKNLRKQIIFFFAILLIAPFLISCYTYETITDYAYVSAEKDYNEKYRGCTRTQIINDCGAPDRIVPIEGVSVILVYEKYRTISLSDPLGLGIVTRTTKRSSYVEFYIGNDSKCYNVKTNKEKAIPYQKTVRKSIFDY